ncbi:YqhV family protein [Geobacillus subterraneus]|uniref:YqhV family protein n=1 Tax=Geobacillus subterraneus TaxID=129338 RepID=UPI001442E041|nr:YqhV family protein [Geobacillus subterraneus]QIZ68331.1 YqhV family protein [Geobacillus subterraneus]WPZ17355.1 YqhV family protein [Geobacillus subterraneus]
MKHWLRSIDPSVLAMAGMRMLSALVELSAALLMLAFNDVKKALAINAALAVVGPTVMIVTMAIGLLSLADELSFSRLGLVALGVAIILFAIYK